jgi:glycosyltransferase involved in cell wall biosynthesis
MQQSQTRRSQPSRIEHIRQPRLFRSFFIGGLESSTHRFRSGRRLDLLESTQHTRFVRQDYQRLQSMGMHTIRSAIRWHLIEQRPGHYDFSSVLPMVRTAQEMGMQVIWDLCHYGWPDDLDIYTPAFITRFAKMCTAFAHVIASETDAESDTPFFCPMNEISFFAWAGGDVAALNPFSRDRGPELKVQLARAAIEAVEAVWQVLPQARIVHIDPIIHLVADPERPEDIPEAEGYRLAQYEGWDMICGRLAPEIGGHPKYLDILGLNYYPRNQWIHNSLPITRAHPLYRRLYRIVREIYQRYERPLFIAETGEEGKARPNWLRNVAKEVAEMVAAGLPVEGLCLYPIFCHPGWNDNRHCPNGLWDYADASGNRPIYEPLAEEVRRQQRNLEAVLAVRQQQIEEQDTMNSTEDNPPRVCLFTDSLEPSGMGEHMLLLAEQLKQHYTLFFVCPPTEHGLACLQRAEALGIATLPLAVHDDDQSALERFSDYLKEHAIDLVHIHAGIGWEGHNGVYAADLANVPAIVRTEHLPYLLTDPEQQRQYHKMIEHVDQVITVSEVARRSYIERKYDPSRITAIANGIRRMQLDPVGDRHALCQMLGIPEDACIVITVARLVEQKGHRDLLAAIPEVLRKQPHTLFLWLGSGPLEAELRQRIHAQGLEDHVWMMGMRKDIAPFLRAADLLVMPSLFEGMPLALLEAMSGGVPIVATHVGGNAELIENEVHGRLVPPSDPPAMAQAIVDALANPEQRERWRTAARQRFESAFTAEQMASAVDAFYQRALRQSVPRRQPLSIARPVLPVAVY